MPKRLLTITFLVAAMAGLVQTSQAQYLWMDANGDGVNTAADKMSPNGTPTTVDVWINTTTNRNGSPAVCQSGDPDAALSTWNSFATHVDVHGGTVTFSGYVNAVTAFTISCSNTGLGFTSSSTSMAQCQATGTPVSNGGNNIKLYTVTVTGASGTPSLVFVPGNSLDNNPTSFGSQCGGLDFDNTIKLGSDFMDADGIPASAGGTNSPPVVSAPAIFDAVENAPVSVAASASDPDAGQLVTLSQTNNAPFLAGPASSGPSATPSLTLTGTPSFTAAGVYTVNWSAVDNGASPSTAVASTSIVIANTDRPPTVTAPATASGNEGTLIIFTVTASDPDADAITVLDAAGSAMLAGASFSSNVTHTSGTFSWTPSFTQAGSYSATFSATSNALSASATTNITVNNVDHDPVVTAPATASTAEGSLLTFNVTAADPDGDPIARLIVADTTVAIGSTFVANASNTSGTFSWTPSFSQAGTYNVPFAALNARTGFTMTIVTVTNVDRAPVVTAPASASGNEGMLITFGVSATDANGGHLFLTALGLPSGASFIDNGDNTGAFSWTPNFAQAGTYPVTFRANDGNGGTSSAITSITVNNVDQAPTANADGPYTGVTNAALTFNGAASSDPDGDALTYAWDFGDADTGTGPTPSHTYTVVGTYNVTLTVTANGLSDTDATTAAISDAFDALAFQTGGNKSTSLASGKPYTCVQIQPVNGSYANGDVDRTSIRMVYPVGATTSILSDPTKTSTGGDKNSDGIAEIGACFSKSDMRVLFAGLPAGSNTVTVEIRGSLVGGGQFSATLTTIVKSNGTFLAASISPNPLNPQAKLSFVTTKPGAVRVQMFDPQGRLVKTITDETSVQAGYHDFTIDGRSSTGSKLASGVYFVKVWSQFDGTEVKSITILK